MQAVELLSKTLHGSAGHAVGVWKTQLEVSPAPHPLSGESEKTPDAFPLTQVYVEKQNPR